MINSYFGFTKNPFSRDVPAKEMLLWQEFENLKLRFDYFLQEGGIFLLTGSIGSGKTTALKYFASTINPNTHQVLYCASMFDAKKDFYRTILTMCGVTPSFYTGDCRNMLRKHFIDMHLSKRLSPVIIIDEAQNAPGFLLEEIRLLSNFDYDSSSPVLFILSGHKLLQQRLSYHENEALRQRLTLKFNLNCFGLEETCIYIKHRLTNAGSTGAIFADSVLAKIHEASTGVPRMINKICNTLFIAAVASEKKVIDENLFDASRKEWE
jgi:general secretion pathway protein A